MLPLLVSPGAPLPFFCDVPKIGQTSPHAIVAWRLLKQAAISSNLSPAHVVLLWVLASAELGLAPSVLLQFMSTRLCRLWYYFLHNFDDRSIIASQQRRSLPELMFLMHRNRKPML